MKKFNLNILVCAILIGSGVTFPGVSQAWTEISGNVQKGPVDQAEADARECVRLIESGKLDEASKKINQALSVRADKSYYHLLNALVYNLQAKAGKNSAFDLADQGYKLAIQFDASNWLAYQQYAQFLAENGRYAESVSMASEALMFRSDDVSILRLLAYSAYRAGIPDVAAGSIKRLDSLSPLELPDDLRNAAMIMAAAGDGQSAKSYLDKLSKTDGIRFEQLSGIGSRVKDWSSFHESKDGMIKTAGELPNASSGFGGAAAGGMAAPAVGGFGAAPAGGFGAPQAGGFGTAAGGFGAPMGGGFGMPQMPAVRPTAEGTESKMVIVDVVMIATEENFTSSKGINLLNGLQLQFGNSSTPAFSRSYSSTNGQTLTRAVGIPGVTYTLNIANVNSQRNEILARPTLIARAATPSEFFSGIDLNAVAVSNSANAGSPVNISKQIGVNLKVKPSFLDDGRVALEVSAERTFLQPPSSDVAFTFKMSTSMSRVSANVVMKYGETLILGGLSEKEAVSQRDGVPLLQDIPGVQYAFSNSTTQDYQKSVLILVTPRSPQYIYQGDKARKEFEKNLSEEEKPLANLRSRYSDWFKPYPNWASVFHHLQDNSLYREFRTGDVTLESWTDMKSMKDRLSKIIEFIHY